MSSLITSSGLTSVVIPGGRLVATPNSPTAGALTITIKTGAGNDPSPTEPLFTAFPVSGSPGAWEGRHIVAATSITITPGSNLGLVVTNTPFAVHVVLFEDGQLGVRYCVGPSLEIYPLINGGIASSTAEGGAGEADNNVIYTTTAVSSKVYRILGRLEFASGLAVLGTWDVTPAVHLATVGAIGPGAELYEFGFPYTAVDSTTTTIPDDNTLPQSGEGTAFQVVFLEAQSASNFFDVDIVLSVSHSVAAIFIIAVHMDAGADAVIAGEAYVVADKVTQVVCRGRVRAGTAGSHTLTVHVGAGTAGTWTINGVSGVRKLGGVQMSYLSFKERAG